ncbi:hypothetical protein EV715DRAFT_291866 [Schizophyllum commune]
MACKRCQYPRRLASAVNAFSGEPNATTFGQSNDVFNPNATAFGLLNDSWTSSHTLDASQAHQCIAGSPNVAGTGTSQRRMLKLTSPSTPPSNLPVPRKCINVSRDPPTARRRIYVMIFTSRPVRCINSTNPAPLLSDPSSGNVQRNAPSSRQGYTGLCPMLSFSTSTFLCSTSTLLASKYPVSTLTIKNRRRPIPIPPRGDAMSFTVASIKWSSPARRRNELSPGPAIITFGAALQ